MAAFDIRNVVYRITQLIGEFVAVIGGVDSTNRVRALRLSTDGGIVLAGAATPTIYNLTLVLANTQYSQVLPAATKRFTMQPRTNATVWFAFAAGQVPPAAGVYASMKAGAPFTEWDLELPAAAGSRTVYLSSATAGTIVEIVSWV